MHDEPEHDPAPECSREAVTVSETTLKWDGQKMFDSIVRTAAASLLENIERDVRAEVVRSVKEQITAKVGELVEGTLNTEFQPVNEWGEPKGKPQSLREMVGNTARTYLGAKVDKEGRENSYNGNTDRLSFLVSKVVASEFDYRMQTEIKKAVEMARTEAVAKVGAVVGDLILKLK
jgi:predicted Holliday junction resolvase-like endonuclease